jgi:hypothetical protein
MLGEPAHSYGGVVALHVDRRAEPFRGKMQLNTAL